MDSYMDVRGQCCGHRTFQPTDRMFDPAFSQNQGWDSSFSGFPLYPMDQMFMPNTSEQAAADSSAPASNANWNSCAASCPSTEPGHLEQHYPVAMAYVPWQQWQTTYPPEQGLVQGTIFPDLDLKFAFGGCSK